MCLCVRRQRRARLTPLHHPHTHQNTNQVIADVLQLVVEHVAWVSHPATLCTLLRVSRSVREALQRTRGHCSLQLPDFSASPESMARFASCCSWLPQHIGLVTRLCFGSQLQDSEADEPPAAAAELQTAQQLAGMALSLCATQADAATVAAAAHHKNTQLWAAAPTLAAAASAVPWRLESVTAHLVVTPFMLVSLASCSTLTHLDLSLLQDPCAGASTALFAALGQLRPLRTLKLQGSIAPEPFAAGVSSLTLLQELSVEHKPAHWLSSTGSALFPAACRALPGSLTSLTVTVCELPPQDDGEEVVEPTCVMQFAHLRKLQRLELGLAGPLGAASQLPPSLTYLKFQGAFEPQQRKLVKSLKRLHELVLVSAFEAGPFLQHLSALPKLQKLFVGCSYAFDVAEDFPPLLQAITSAKHLTRLTLADNSPATDGPQPAPLPLGGIQLSPYLRKLTCLRALDLARLDIQPADALQFTALTTLTELLMYNCWSIGDMAAAAIASRLAGNLRVLELIDCCLESPVVWPAVGLCTSLESFCIDSAPHNEMVLDECGLTLLTGLTRLTSLTGVQVTAPAEAVARFRASMPALVVLKEVSAEG